MDPSRENRRPKITRDWGFCFDMRWEKGLPAGEGMVIDGSGNEGKWDESFFLIFFLTIFVFN